MKKGDEINKEFNSVALVSLILYFLFFSSVASAATRQGTMPTRTYAYITNTNSNDISVIDTTKNTVVATVPVRYVPHGVAVMPDGTKVYVTNSYPDNNVSVINTATNTVIATVPV